MEYNYGHNDSNKVYVNGKPVPMTQEQQQAFSDQTFINDVMIRAFMYMFIAVLLTAVVAMYTATSGLYRVVFANPALLILIIVAEFAFVIAGNRQAARNSKVGSAVCLFGYSIVNGLTLSTIFLAYNLQFITFVFLVTSLMFGITAVYGPYRPDSGDDHQYLREIFRAGSAPQRGRRTYFRRAYRLRYTEDQGYGCNEYRV